MVKKTLKRMFVPSAVFFLIALAIVYPRMVNAPTKLEEMALRIGKASLVVEIADTRQAQSLGLSNRDFLGNDQGMLFRYSKSAMRSFWMKGMRFPIDVLWILDGAVVGFNENIPFQSDDGEIVRFASNAPSDAALEVNAGWIAEHGVEIGDLAVLDIVSN